MNFIVEFYRGLDAINLIIFWGVIIVVLLLLIFSIILVNNNKRLKKLLYEKEKDNIENEIPIVKKEKIVNNTIVNNNYKQEEETVNKTTIKNDYKEKELINNDYEKEEIVNNNYDIEENEEKIIIKDDEPVKEETHFIAEEHVIEYKPEIAKEKLPENNNVENVRMPYQKNVLRSMSLNQTSPIGLTTNNNVTKQEYQKAQELNEILNKKDEKSNYLESVSRKLEKAANNGIQRTTYEIKQEEDAIISYEELMRKAHNIQINEEEDAVISIEELVKQKQEQEKLYKITSEAEDDSFIKELKSFRKDL